MKIFIIAIILLSFITLSYADEIKIPVSCYPKEVQAKFLEHGYKLDLSANDREKDSWGFLVSRGSEFSIFTYKQIDVTTLNNIQTIVMEN